MSEHCTHFISGITFGSYWAEKENITRMISSSEKLNQNLHLQKSCFLCPSFGYDFKASYHGDWSDMILIAMFKFLEAVLTKTMQRNHEKHYKL